MATARGERMSRTDTTATPTAATSKGTVEGKTASAASAAKDPADEPFAGNLGKVFDARPVR
jgi:hypothetical protein